MQCLSIPSIYLSIYLSVHFSNRDVSGPHTIRILDLQVSKQHCDITYIRRRESFIVTECGSQNGTFINGERISEVSLLNGNLRVSLYKSVRYILKHEPNWLNNGAIETINKALMLLVTI